MTSGVLSNEQLSRFSIDILTAAGADAEQAAGVTEVLIWADEFGRANQGVWRLPILCKRLAAGLFTTPCRPVVEDRAPAVAVVDGLNGMGHHVGRLAADVAIERARDTGAAVVAVSHGNFLGALGYYVYRMAQADMIGIATSNSFPKVAPHGGVLPVLGTNPMAFAAPRRGGASVIVDLATAATAGSAITKAAELGEPLPEGIAIDRQGQPITDASKVKEGALLPLGGAKGFALGLMVEILSGVVSGAGISHSVYSMYADFEHAGDSGHFFIAIDIAKLMPLATYHDRMEILVEAVRECEGVLLPGERRWQAKSETDAAGGICLDDTTTTALTKLAGSLDVATPW